jgi:hypothetical protein
METGYPGPNTAFAELQTDEGFRYEAEVVRQNTTTLESDSAEVMDPGETEAVLYLVMIPEDAKPRALYGSFNGPAGLPGSVEFRLKLSGVPMTLPKGYYGPD